MDALNRIKQLVWRRQIILTAKAEMELWTDNLTIDQVGESIMNARRIDKTLNSKSPTSGAREKLYVIRGSTFAGTQIYSKGKIIHDADKEYFYVLISSKRSL
ncbi:MAG TPA: hypothetical protein VG722_05805 [Tepidisphaeraceae bacterium]|nr:hypothetical protein [Tepidisphaeraceae bacterium]